MNITIFSQHTKETVFEINLEFSKMWPQTKGKKITFFKNIWTIHSSFNKHIRNELHRMATSNHKYARNLSKYGEHES